MLLYNQMEKINTCSRNHTEVAYDSAACPMCSVMDTVTMRINETIEYVDKVVDDQNELLRSLQMQVWKLKLKRYVFGKKIHLKPLKMVEDVNWSGE